MEVTVFSIMMALLASTRKSARSVAFEGAALVPRSQKSEMVERFDLLIRPAQNKMSQSRRILWHTMMVLIIGLSFTFVLQSKSEPPIEDIVPPGSTGVYEFSEKDSWIVQRADGSYQLYLSEQDIHDEISDEGMQFLLELGFDVRREHE